jgi:hypothetical protein
MMKIFWSPVVHALSECEGAYVAQLESWRGGSAEDLTRDVVVVDGESFRVLAVNAAEEQARFQSGELINVVLQPIPEALN